MEDALKRIDELAHRAVRIARDSKTEEAVDVVKTILMLAIADSRMEAPFPTFDDCETFELSGGRHITFKAPKDKRERIKFISLWSVVREIAGDKRKKFHTRLLERLKE